MDSFGLDAKGIVNSVVATLFVAGLLWAFGWVRLRVGLLSDRLTVRILRRELDRVLELANDPSRTSVFLLRQVIVCLAILGVSIAYAPMAVIENGGQYVLPFVAALGLSLYGCAIYALGILNRVAKGDAFISRQRARIEALEARISRRTAGARDAEGI